MYGISCQQAWEDLEESCPETKSLHGSILWNLNSWTILSLKKLFLEYREYVRNFQFWQRHGKRCSCPPHLALCKAGGQHVRYFPWALLVAILLASQWAHLPGIERFWEITRFMSYSCGPHSQPKEMYHMYQLTIKIGQQNRHLWKKGTFFAFRDPQVVEFLFAAFSAHLCRFWIWGQHNPRAPGVVTLQLVETTMVNHRIQLVQGFFHSEYLAISFIWCCFKMF